MLTRMEFLLLFRQRVRPCVEGVSLVQADLA